MTDIKTRLRELLDIEGITQQDMSDRTKIDKSTLSLYFSGKRIPKQNNIDIISRTYNVDPAWLMGYDVPINNNVSITSNIISNQLANLQRVKTAYNINKETNSFYPQKTNPLTEENKKTGEYFVTKDNLQEILSLCKNSDDETLKTVQIFIEGLLARRERPQNKSINN